MASKSRTKRLKERYGKQAKKSSPTDVKKSSEAAVKVEPRAPKATWYDNAYRYLLIIPFLILVIAIAVIVNQYTTTGDFFNKGISLSGGTAIAITPDMAPIQGVDTTDLRNELQNRFPTADVVVRSQDQLTTRVALEVEVDITDEDELIAFKQGLIAIMPELTMQAIDSSSRTSGSALGEAFVTQIFTAMLVAFLLMGIVVFIQFKVPIPSLAVMLAAFSDIVVTLAIINILGIKVSTAGIAAFLMLIGYSVDTDILLSTRVLKRKEGTINERIFGAFKTGMTMNITTLAAVTVALIVSESGVITQIMTIIFIGLLVDMINTWLQNAGILKWYAEGRK